MVKKTSAKRKSSQSANGPPEKTGAKRLPGIDFDPIWFAAQTASSCPA
jgi:hypothetical protein